MSGAPAPEEKARVALFATCLVDLMRPSVGFAAAKLLEDAGYAVEVPQGQTCCGQPNYNGGDRAGAVALAQGTIEVLEGFDYVVVPSGSCGATIAKHYPRLFAEGSPWRGRAEELAARTHELAQFLVKVAKVERVGARIDAVATYHDSCSGLRELKIKSEPRQLLGLVEGLTLKELIDPELCCGFGGTFSIKYPDVSGKMAGDKVFDVQHADADMVIAGDVGCLMQIEGRLRREGARARAFHVAEVLAGFAGEEAP